MENTEQLEHSNQAKKRNGQVDRVSPVTGRLLDVAVTIKGVTALLVNAVPPEVLEAIRVKDKKPKNAPVGTPREEASKHLYVEGNKFFLPSRMLYSCLVAAGQYVRLDGKRQISTASKTVLPAFFVLQTDTLWLDTPGWEADIQQGRNPNGGELVVLCRPRFDAWGFKCNIQIDTREIGEELIRNLFDVAGSRCGLGDFRPGRKGSYGKFRVEEWRRL